ncbi:MAG: STAS domain-containing protein [Oscillospiraceae bacterium]|nr:STAS domain-containing protein [Oscillospiraceae bacterium]
MIFINKSGDGSDSRGFSFTEESNSDGTAYFALKGHVGLNEASFMEDLLEKAAQSGCNRIIINMCLVNSFSSAGIRVILAMYKKLKSTGGKLQIDNPSENVKNVIGLVALDELLLR